jgi:hypothetical protein
MDDQELLLGVGEPHRHRVAQLDRVGATGPVLGHHGDTKEALEQGTILDPPLPLIPRPRVLAVGQGRPALREAAMPPG